MEDSSLNGCLHCILPLCRRRGRNNVRTRGMEDTKHQGPLHPLNKDHTNPQRLKQQAQGHPLCVYYSFQHGVVKGLLSMWTSGSLTLVPPSPRACFFVFSNSDVLFSIYLYYYTHCIVLLCFLEAFFFSHGRQKVSGSGSGQSGKELGGVEGGETVSRI